MRARLALAALLACAAALTVAPSAPAVTHECNGLMICVPVSGPWVVVQTTAKQATEYQVECPRGYIVGGLDAELSTPAIDVTFSGTMGSPVNPGITTSTAAVFSARYVGTTPGIAPSVRPHVGCIPASGGGGRVPTSVRAVFPPGKPTARRVRDAVVLAGSSRVTQRCASGERLVAASHAIGFFTQDPPTPRFTRGVRTQQLVRSGRIVVTVQATKAAANLRPMLQIGAVCAGGK